MAIINLRKYYYPTYKTNTFIEGSDEVAEALLLMLRAENNYNQKRLFRKCSHRAGQTRSYDELLKDTQQFIGYVLRGQKQIPCQFWRV